MKKNFAMRIAACLLVVTMLSLCMVSYTYAKYTTTGSATDTAKVAAWGIELEVSADTKLYDIDKTTDDVNALKVAGNTLVAPGTYQRLAHVELSGTPEVAFEVVVDVNLDLGSNWVVEGDVYCPLVFTVAGTEYKIDATNTTTAKLEEAVENAVKAALGAGTYKIGDTLTAVDCLIDCTWAFNGDNAKDTALGNAADKATVGFYLTVTVNQLN